MSTIRIGCGAGYSGDRIEPAVELAEKGELDYLVFECLAERTIALAQHARAKNPDGGFDPLLAARMTAVLRPAAAHGVTIVTNMGAANPPAAARLVCDLARSLGLPRLRVAAILGDDVLDEVKRGRYVMEELDAPAASLGEALVSANAYIGAEPICEALARGADVVIAGRAADPSMFLAPAMHEFGWAADDWIRLGRGTLAGHLLECAGQVTGGYFADPGYKDVADLARLGFPIGVIDEEGGVEITKVPGSGGRVTPATCQEQLLYEIHDPASYVTPDVVADFSRVRVTEVAPDRVALEGATGRERPGALKVSVGYFDGFIGEGQISYGGPGAVARAELARAIVTERLRLTGVAVDELRSDLIGVDSLHGAPAQRARRDPWEVRLRVAARTRSMADARRVANEVEALYTNGPAAGGGATSSAREVLAIGTTFVPRTLVRPAVHLIEA